jgi:predicted nucleic acid-binding protein
LTVTDTSAVVSALLRDGAARDLLGAEQVHVPHLIDAEVANVLRQLVLGGRLAPGAGTRLIGQWSRLGVTRHGGVGLLPRVWKLRDDLSAYDALFVALAEALECHLVTADARLARAPGIRCPVTVVPG